MCSHSSAARAQCAEARRQQAALESSGDVVIVEEEDGPAEADAEDDGVDEADGVMGHWTTRLRRGKR